MVNPPCTARKTGYIIHNHEAVCRTTDHNVSMEDVVAVEVTLHTGEHRDFLTWGRIFDPVDGTALAALVLEHAPSTELGGEPVSARVCPTLSEARDQPYFYEALIDFGWRRPQFGDGYEAWRRDRETALREGRELYYLGRR